MTAEEFILERVRHCSNEIDGGGWNNGEHTQLYQPWITPDQALRAVEMAREDARRQLLAEAVEFTVVDVDEQNIELGFFPPRNLNIGREGDKVKVVFVREDRP